MGKSTISMVIFNSKLWHNQRVTDPRLPRKSHGLPVEWPHWNIVVVFFHHGWTKKFIDDGWSTHNLHFFDGKMNGNLHGYGKSPFLMGKHPLISFHWNIPWFFVGSTFDMLCMGQWVTRPIHCARSQWYQPQGSWIWWNYPMITSE